MTTDKKRTRSAAKQMKMKPTPEMTPLVSPGMPCTTVTWLLSKYWSQVALSSADSQKSFHSAVVTVTLSTTSVFRQLSNLWF